MKRELWMRIYRPKKNDEIKKMLIQSLIGKIEKMKKNMSYDLPTNDFCYSEHDVSNSYDKGIDEVLSILKKEL